jgi:predicted alpha/beta superfamily hydrolase
VLALLSVLLGGFAHAAAQPKPEPITIGSSYVLSSAPLGEDRTLNVVLPASYGKSSDKRYPVLYLIDGGVDQDLLHVTGVLQLNSAWGRSREAILVGIATKDRRRELTAPVKDAKLLKQYPTAGSSALFRRFIRDEVKPFVERSYRTNGYDAVIGESLAGLFILDTYLAEPSLFDAYGAISPSLWWDQEAVSKSAAAELGAKQRGRRLYFAAANEGEDMRAADDRVVDALKAKEKDWCFNLRDDLVHSTIYQQLTPQALQYLLPPAEAPPPEYGFEVRCTHGS